MNPLYTAQDQTPDKVNDQHKQINIVEHLANNEPDGDPNTAKMMSGLTVTRCAQHNSKWILMPFRPILNITATKPKLLVVHVIDIAGKLSQIKNAQIHILHLLSEIKSFSSVYINS